MTYNVIMRLYRFKQLNTFKEVFVMAFVKEIVPEADKELYNSFEIKDELDELDKNYIYKWYPDNEWVVDREREIYFIYVTGGQNEAHPMQFNLIYNGEKWFYIVQWIHMIHPLKTTL